ncbi:hypothetical protein EC973_001132 [Apophysomyces ossiformis]|uniref:BZIP domain-containing protein n=1 Tax=Apophysomyces ossiformis TaxID=679940 RepID=A0A8H7ENE9_9FUNG|nr:hypothetical protein EC973_001132 [Apophysomyces ossiformis]
MTEIAFEYFDPEIELNNLDENGRRIRPRRKPGRKPNPPSPAQRKAQNRAAQRAFRERKRKEIRDAEAIASRCMKMYDQVQCETRMLKRKVNELRYENNYLKGLVLSLKLACAANGVTIPKLCEVDVADELGFKQLVFSQTKDIPYLLEFFLDKHLHIIGVDTVVGSHGPSSPEHARKETPGLENDDEEETMALFQPSVNLCRLLDNGSSPTLSASAVVTTAGAAAEDVIVPSHLLFDLPSLSATELSPDLGNPDDESILLNDLLRTPPPYLPSQRLFPPMSPLEVVDKFRSMKGDKPLLTPTELQRTIPHDARIDAVPGPDMRDHMIIFQDFYDADELFNTLLESARFMGGELGNPDCWFVPPSFLRRYWFLCPNHKSERTDNVEELALWVAQHMNTKLLERKQMYNQRENYPDLFPPPTINPWEKEALEERLSADVPIDVMLDVMGSMPRLTSPNAFTL